MPLTFDLPSGYFMSCAVPANSSKTIVRDHENLMKEKGRFISSSVSLICDQLIRNEYYRFDNISNVDISDIIAYCLLCVYITSPDKDVFLSLLNNTRRWMNKFGTGRSIIQFDPYKMLYLHENNEGSAIKTLSKSCLISDRKKEFIRRKIVESPIFSSMIKEHDVVVSKTTFIDAIEGFSSGDKKINVRFITDSMFRKNVEEIRDILSLDLRIPGKVSLENYPIDKEISETIDKIIDETIDVDLMRRAPCEFTVTDLMVDIIKSLSPEESLSNGWEDTQSFISEIDMITKCTNLTNDRLEQFRKNFITNLQNIIDRITKQVGDYARRESEANEVYKQLIAENTPNSKECKASKTKVIPVPVTNSGDDNPKLEQAITTDLQDERINFVRKYKISKRVRRWSTKDVDKIRKFTDGNKLSMYARMDENKILESRMFHNLPGTDLFIDNEAYAFNTKTGKGLIVVVNYNNTTFNGVLYFGIKKGNIIYHRYVEPLSKDVSSIFLSKHIEKKTYANDADWETDGLFEINEKERGVIEIKYPDENYSIDIHPIRPELLF